MNKYITTLVFAAMSFGVSASKPSIICILADDLGYGDVQCLNPEQEKIPIVGKMDFP